MPMVLNLLKAGFSIWFMRATHPRSKNGKRGPSATGSPTGVASTSTVIVSIVSDIPDVESIILARDGVNEGIKPGSLVIDMSTFGEGVCAKRHKPYRDLTRPAIRPNSAAAHLNEFFPRKSKIIDPLKRQTGRTTAHCQDK